MPGRKSARAPAAGPLMTYTYNNSISITKTVFNNAIKDQLSKTDRVLRLQARTHYERFMCYIAQQPYHKQHSEVIKICDFLGIEYKHIANICVLANNYDLEHHVS